MADYRIVLGSVADRLAGAAAGLHVSAGIVAVATAVGAVLGTSGLSLLGVPFVVAAGAGGVMALPIIGLWRLRAVLDALSYLPGRARSLPASLNDAHGRLGESATGAPAPATSSPTPRGFVRSLRVLRQLHQEIQRIDPAAIVALGVSLTPATFVAGGFAALWGVVSFTLGTGIMVLALAFG